MQKTSQEKTSQVVVVVLGTWRIKSTQEMYTEGGGNVARIRLYQRKISCLTDVREGSCPCCTPRVQEGEGESPEGVQGLGVHGGVSSFACGAAY